MNAAGAALLPWVNLSRCQPQDDNRGGKMRQGGYLTAVVVPALAGLAA